jgi:hypothetical protein
MCGGRTQMLNLWTAFFWDHGGRCAGWSMYECDHPLHGAWILQWDCFVLTDHLLPFLILENGLRVSKIYVGNNHTATLCCWGAVWYLLLPLWGMGPAKGHSQPHYSHMSTCTFPTTLKGPFFELNPTGVVLASFSPFQCRQPDILKLSIQSTHSILPKHFSIHMNQNVTLKMEAVCSSEA